MLEVQAPIHIRRKSRYWNALKIRPSTWDGLLRGGLPGGVTGNISLGSTYQAVSNRNGSSILARTFLPHGWRRNRKGRSRRSCRGRRSLVVIFAAVAASLAVQRGQFGLPTLRFSVPVSVPICVPISVEIGVPVSVSAGATESESGLTGPACRDSCQSASSTRL